MTTSTFDNIFTLMYTLYRAESVVPTSTDDEYTIGMRFANEAISRWANYDGTYWKELFTTAQTNSAGGVVTITTGVTSYAAPTAFREAGGYVKILNSDGNAVRNYPIVDPQEAQFRNDMATYAYFTFAAGGAATLHLNPAPDSSISGMGIDYVYYKKPTEFTAGASTTECPNAEFIVHRMLYNRLRTSRNPYMNTALRDSEDMLKIMKMDNDSGTWANPAKVPDRSGSAWGF